MLKYASQEGQYGLVAFRLADIPLDLRTSAVEALVRRRDSALTIDQAGTGGLLARVTALSQGDNTGDAETLRKIAREPSDRVYWIPRPAWESVFGDAE